MNNHKKSPSKKKKKKNPSKKQSKRDTSRLVPPCRHSSLGMCAMNARSDFMLCQWPLTSYGHERYYPSCIAADVSFEELRWDCWTSGADTAAHVRRADQLTTIQRSKRTLLLARPQFLFAPDPRPLVFGGSSSGDASKDVEDSKDETKADE
eukprot:TRINITY_DN65875_c5_g2_i1.p1 TRINITY_DN65875_c5_g2~~TRINITY_DN65875_c5_g2_i1.p1  ORF type:complete len:173 (+),score=78.71 TRINITY_DN65875_c5_g2_i1:67-519(+)